MGLVLHREVRTGFKLLQAAPQHVKFCVLGVGERSVHSWDKSILIGSPGSGASSQGFHQAPPLASWVASCKLLNLSKQGQ